MVDCKTTYEADQRGDAPNIQQHRQRFGHAYMCSRIAAVAKSMMGAQDSIRNRYPVSQQTSTQFVQFLLNMTGTSFGAAGSNLTQCVIPRPSRGISVCHSEAKPRNLSRGNAEIPRFARDDN